MKMFTDILSKTPALRFHVSISCRFKFDTNIRKETELVRKAGGVARKGNEKKKSLPVPVTGRGMTDVKENPIL